MTTWRLVLVLVRGASHVALGFFIVAVVFRFVDETRRAAYVRRWSQKLLAICGVDRRVVPPATDAPRGDLAAAAMKPGGLGAMLVMNHVSWLDIFVVHAERPAHFIAKAEIGRWPVAGYMTAQSGAIFIERGKRHAVREANQRVATMLTAGGLVGMFPEGTTSDGDRLLPFHSNLIQPAIRAQVPIVVAGVRYRDRSGAPTTATLYTGDIGLFDSLLRIVRGGPLFAELRVIGAIETTGTTRHAIAQRARTMIAEAFGFDDEAVEVAEGLSTMIALPDDDLVVVGNDDIPFNPVAAPRGTEPGIVLDPRDELL